MPGVLLIGCDHDVSVTGLTAGGGYLNAATVTYALYDATGTAVANGSGTLSYTAASNGNYTGAIESTVTAGLTEGGRYTLRYEVVSGGYTHGWAVPHYAARDGG